MPTVTSADGTTIAYQTTGTGPALILVDGAMSYRDFGPARGLAQSLADQYTVYFYDRRGRGASGNTLPWSEDREIDDLAALLTAAGGTAYALGVSSGAVLTADAANRLPGLTKIALYEPPFIVGNTGRGVPLDPTRWSNVTAPALVLDGGKSPQYMRNAAKALSEALPKAGYQTLPGQTHMVKAAALAPAVKEFLAG